MDRQMSVVSRIINMSEGRDKVCLFVVVVLLFFGLNQRILSLFARPCLTWGHLA